MRVIIMMMMMMMMITARTALSAHTSGCWSGLVTSEGNNDGDDDDDDDDDSNNGLDRSVCTHVIVLVRTGDE